MMATNVNPMQVPYGYNPQAPNQQFAAQNNIMMGGQPMMTPNPVQQVPQQINQAPVQQQTPQQVNQTTPAPNATTTQQTPIVSETGQLTL